MNRFIRIQLVLLLWLPFFFCSDPDEGPQLVWDDSKVWGDQMNLYEY